MLQLIRSSGAQKRRLTCFHLKRQSPLAVLNQLVQLNRIVRNAKVEHSHNLFRLVELDHFFVPFVLSFNVVQANVYDSVQKLSRPFVGASVHFEREQV